MKNVFTSDVEYSPLVGDGGRVSSSETRPGSYVQPLPREMMFLVHKGQTFTEMYDYIRFPPESDEQVRTVVSRHTHLKGTHPVMTSVVQDKVDSVSSKEHHSGRERSASRRKSGDNSSKGEALTMWTKAEEKKGAIGHSRARERLVQVCKVHRKMKVVRP